MTAKFKDKSAFVIVVDASGSTRLMMTSTLRGLGFANVIGVESLSEALGHLTQGQCDWLITSLFPEEKVNALHILQLTRRHPELRHMLVSLYATEAEYVFLSRAFALGLCTWHPKPFNKQSFEDNTVATIKGLETHDGQSVFVAAASARLYLQATRKSAARVALETMLTREYPDRTDLLLSLAEACFEAKDETRARSLLWQVEQRDESLVKQAQALGEKHVSVAAEAETSIKAGVCLVVDPDAAVLNSTEQALKVCGAAQVHTFTRGDACWDWLDKNPVPAVLIMEWRLPGMTGPALIQRLQTKTTGICSVIVNSSLLTGKDLPLVEEMGVVAILEKPTSRSDLMNSISWCVEQANKPTEKRSLERRFRGQLRQGKIDEAFQTLQLFVKKVGRDLATLKGLEAELVFAQGDFAQAQKLAKASMNLGNRSVVTMNLLGKAMMQLGEYAAANQVFEKANELSPQSIDRLCALAEVQAELGDETNAMQSLQRAETIDKDSPNVVTAAVKVAMVTGNAELAKDRFAKLPASYNVVAYVNNRAVSMTKSGNYSDGITQYDNALKAIPVNRGDLRSIVAYNLALAKVHSGDMKGALKLLRGLPVKMEEQLQKKVVSLRDKLELSVRTGEKPQLNLQPKPLIPAGAPVKSKRFKLSTDPVKPEQRFCLFGLFNDDEPRNTLVETLMANPPTLTMRKSG